ncbi:phosphodiester glycosidase family protein [Anabaena cylindrica FACHB-243]|uniref:Phosphodiester glycosidase domain-containing protein n=1 Tax=Anabaena cylindrica (strain ATCC 27899 / PCC 7122) TaxID=272123 RepID=K9ZDP5_ANACC|nr:MULTISPECIES: phosphodiester glycosidase family protein [Anabaena]AFZ57333.1 hypothetical protein Anacy_1843 [Anabaena cylindrica PCC 7122]MBD2421001.1 phosphodiester glycosidase family protein [Anabaena cylindrica FACHB-243]MBY5280705.1 phosphodiester glycosidase family protein [Anabaena sp. CCAP 1446/1C]MBY5306909.1 phosphodiester glycosidase family protein [Anabaena sp. CCAP 1446/1C]MCM2405754.1 phosphodiester glycosidase family protein [Anabaena sp. CCAP 1446/1C]
MLIIANLRRYLNRYLNQYSQQQKYLTLAGGILLVSPLIYYNWLHFLRPNLIDEKRELFKGVIYQRYTKSTPRSLLIHIVTIDLTTPKIKPFVTPGIELGDRETIAQTVPEFLTKYKLQIAINGSYFHPFREITPWDFYPHSSEQTFVLGQLISNGKIYSEPEKNWHILCFDRNNRVQITGSINCPSGTVHGIAGEEILIFQNQVKNSFYLQKYASSKKEPKEKDLKIDKPYPRAAVGIDKEGKKLWLVLVDGKQPLYSEGMTKAELTKLFVDLGVYSALNLDGGGSTTLAISTTNSKNNGVKLLNAVIHTKLPMRDRPVANHLGFYAENLP